ncbi:rab GTPase-binding effector protein 2 isoform X1 [Conger conger]|uniref:rab GTPase-binding effector protein 2 isoform X1 n=1 Tax=Conger conger TaxID=82655 RepID=UPI002A5A4759|nr:rab GTPase-binding effector protein 2 isoform X1 [Conger conger]
MSWLAIVWSCQAGAEMSWQAIVWSCQAGGRDEVEGQCVELSGRRQLEEQTADTVRSAALSRSPSLRDWLISALVSQRWCLSADRSIYQRHNPAPQLQGQAQVRGKVPQERSMGSSQKGKCDGDAAQREVLRRGGQMDRETCSQGGGQDSELSELEPQGEGADSEGGGLLMEGYFSQHCDTSSLSSFSLDTPSLPRRLPPQEDTASLLSTGTLVPEAIYLPPPGHRLVTHTDWDALHTQVLDLQGELARVRDERSDLERELASHTADTQRQVSVLQSQVQTSEALLQDLQKSLSQSQNAVQSRLAELSLSQKKMCSELSRLRGGEPLEDGGEDPLTILSPALQGAHCEERLRIEIVNLKEQLETRAEESEVLEVQLSSLKTEMDRIQGHNDKLQKELHACRTELSGLRVALSHLQRDCKVQSNDKSALQQQCLEMRSQVISLRSQLETSQTVQRDFVQLSQSLQVKLELIRQAETMGQVKDILGEGLTDDVTKPAETT